MRSADRVSASARTAHVAILALAGFLYGAPATAQTVYRCVQKGKPVSLQSTPCENGATTTKTREYLPERSPTANELAWQRYRTEREMQARNEAQHAQSRSGVTVVLPSGGGACEQAKAERDAWERRVGLSRTIDGMRAWQDYVYRACR